jgi:hypothetical protein
MIFTKYNILIALCLPILILFLIRIYDSYKRKKLSKRGAIILFVFWSFLAIGIIFNKQFFIYLENSRLIESTPLSLYDTVQITAIIFLIYLVFRQGFKIEDLKTKVTRLNQSIALENAKKDK